MSSRTRIRVYLILIVIGLGVVSWLYWDTARHRRTLAADPAQEYWLYVPRRCTRDDTCPVFVFVHGTDGSGQDFIKAWRGHADREGFIVICPTFPEGYQVLEGGEDGALIAILDEVGQRYSTAEGAFVSGFSGGAQFAHRFAFVHPERTRAVAVHSAGSYDPPPRQARHIPFLVTIGLNDTERVELARWFAHKLKRAGYDVALVEIEGVGHSLSEQAVQETLELFRRVNNGKLFPQGARLFVFPSLYEGFGLPVLEATACGTPVLCSNVSSLPEVAGETALLVDPVDVKSMAEAMNHLLQDEGLRTPLVERGFRQVRQFSWDQCARETLAVLEE